MKVRLLLVLLYLTSTLCHAQKTEYGMLTQTAFNNLFSQKTNINGTNQAVSHALLDKNRSIGIGFFAKNNKYIYSIYLDASAFKSDYMVDDKIVITDNYNNYEQNIYDDIKPLSNEEFNDVGATFMFGVKIIGNEKYKLFFSNRVGIKNVSDRSSNVVLKESGSNNYYLANYKFNVTPLVSYSPSLEFEFFPYKNSLSFYMYSGLFIQRYTCSTQVDIINAKNLGNTTPEYNSNKHINLSSRVMMGFGFRISLW